MRNVFPGSIVGVTSLLLWTSTAQAEGALVAHYPLREGEGRVARDASGNKNHGRIVGAQWERMGKLHALSFDGVGAVVNCGKPAVLDRRGPMTISAWLRPAEEPITEVGVCGKHMSSYLITIYKTNSAYFYVGDGGNNAGLRGAVVPGAWQQLTGTFDGTTIRLYCNGEPIASRASKFKTVPAGGDFLIGCVRGRPGSADANLRRTDFFKGMIAEVKVYSGALSDDEVRADYQAGAKVLLQLEPVEVNDIKTGPGIEDGSLSVRVGPHGGMRVGVGESFFVVDSRFSYPGETIGHNPLSEQLPAGESTWEPVINRSGDTIEIDARGGRYWLRRRVSVANETVTIRDTVRNVGKGPVGVLIEHRVTVPQTIKVARLAQSTEDPIVFLAQPGFDLGIVGQDSLSRAYFSPFAAANQAGFKIDGFGLDVGKEHTFVWKLYALPPTGDDFALVNKLRSDWGSNHTILGPCYFFQWGDPRFKDPAKFAEYLDRHNVKVAMLSPWLGYDPGSYLGRTPDRAEYKDIMRRMMEALKAVEPDLKCVGCIETDWVGIWPDKIEGGEKLLALAGPTSSVRWLEPAHVKILEDAGLPWMDSVKRSPDGKVPLEIYHRANKPQFALGVYPAPGNHHAKFMLEAARFICEDVGLDGIYVDEFNCDWFKSYGTWDGHSVQIDGSTGKIVGKYTDGNVAGIGPRRELIEYVLDRGKIMIANTYPSTTEETRLPVMRFGECFTFFDLGKLPKGKKPPFLPFLGTSQFGTPIALGVTRPKGRIAGAEELMRGIILYLRHGMLYYHYAYGDIPATGEGSGEYGPINHMFPITPRRLLAGGVIGEERTITCVSGAYQWKHADKPEVLVFDEAGRAKKGDFDLRRSDGGWSVQLRLKDWSEIAVIE